ncbi:alginate lyase family protein [Salinicola avicenniae]|uniref:alginate lyase family protein n=1 Tax=Salinicola avicenniae TaxID=2916836 RepID=UPI00207355B1|nr:MULTISPECIES: alginate lyase family protein [unclassified Salinicola]
MNRMSFSNPRRLVALLAAMALLGLSFSASAMTYEARQELDLSRYTVTDPDASYFDVDARMALLAQTDNDLLQYNRDQLQHGFSCQQALQTPALDSVIRIPGYYPQPQAWELASEPLFDFEDTMSNLAGAYVASGDDYYADCVVRFLDKWATQDALSDFYYSRRDPQAWYSTESMMFAAAMAYSIVRPAIADERPEAITRINHWLNQLAHRHSSIRGGENSCCNNHFYRRALYASMIGVLTDDDELFQFGVSAIYSALSDMLPNGALPREMARGRRASHYQNYALLYLVNIMQVAYRQGYDLFELEYNGHTINEGVQFALDTFDDPAALGDLATHNQYRGFLDDEQYLAWMEIYLDHRDDARISRYVSQKRPIDNRSAGGYATLYFMDPDAQERALPEPKPSEDGVPRELAEY